MKERKIQNKVLPVIVILAVLIALVFGLSGFFTDLLWFRELGYVSVFLKEIVTKLKLGIPTFIIGVLIILLLFKALKSGFLKKNSMTVPEDKVKHLRRSSALLAIVFGVILTATVIPKLWFQILKFMNATDFGVKDPLFQRDLGFYMFKLDFLEGLGSVMVELVIMLLAVTAVYYALLAGLSKDAQGEADSLDYEFPESTPEASERPWPFGFRPGGVNMKKKGKALLSVASNEIMLLGVIFFLAIGVSCYLRRFGLLYGGTGAAYGAGYTDIKVTLSICNILIALSVLSAVGVVIAFAKKKFRFAVICPALMAVAVIAQAPLASLVQSVIVEPDELNKESRYLGYNIEYTQKAYGLDKINVKNFTPNSSLSKVDVLNNMETFSNIRINDFEPAEQFYNQTQSIRSYYSFNDVDVDRYRVNGEYTQTFLSARELDDSLIEDSWLIKHIKYTHGYGVTMSRVDKVTTSGQPEMIIASIPPVSEVEEIDITRPEIYYGESTNNYIIVNTGEPEFDYPSGESNTYCEYEGVGGISLSPFSRILFAIRENSLKMLVSSNIDSNSRIMIYRNINRRVDKIAPFLTYDHDPYIVTVGGKLYWIINAYTTSENYPYSEPYLKDRADATNYVRNSVKVIIDAYNGTTDFYIVDETDPVVMTLSKIYPKLFKSMDEMPEGFKAHLQYPTTLFRIQAGVYEKYHTSDVNVLYQNEDPWQVSNEIYGQIETAMVPSYFIMKLPGEDKAEFVSTLSYSPRGKSNLTAIITARNDGEHYGEIVLYRMPKDRIIYGPAQIEAQINQDTDISKEFALWNNSGSNYSRGNLFVIPVEESLLYVEPIYLESATGSLPEVKRVVAFFDDRIAYEPTLAKCLDKLFGAGAGSPLNSLNPIEAGKEAAIAVEKGEETIEPVDPGEKEPEDPGSETLSDLAILAGKAYDDAQKAMKNGDWAEYGKCMDELSKIISKMAKGAGEGVEGEAETFEEPAPAENSEESEMGK